MSMSFVERMQEAIKQLEAPRQDPWLKPISSGVKGVQAMSTVALLDIVHAAHTTKNSRRLAAIMRELGFVPIQSRRLMPGGYRDTVTRGWSRPMRPLPTKKVKPRQGTRSPPFNLATTGDDDVDTAVPTKS
jgi:hypothetical protein